MLTCPVIQAIHENRKEIFGAGYSSDNAISFLEELISFYNSSPNKKLDISKIARSTGVPRTRLQYLLDDPSNDFQDRLLGVILPLLAKRNQRISYYVLSAKCLGHFGVKNLSGLPDSIGVFAIEIEGLFYPLTLIENNCDDAVSHILKRILSIRFPSHSRSFFINALDENQANEILNKLPTHLCCSTVQWGLDNFSWSKEVSKELNASLKKGIRGDTPVKITSGDRKSYLYIKLSNEQNMDSEISSKIEFFSKLNHAKESLLIKKLSDHFEYFRAKNGTKSNVSQLSRLSLFISISKLSSAFRSGDPV